MPADYVLDTFAVMAFLRGEPGGMRVQTLLGQARAAEASLYFCMINYGEVTYISERRGGRRAAQEAIRIVDNLPIMVVPADRKLTFAAAHVKANYPLSYADAFAVALTQKIGATLVSGDPEFKNLDSLIRIEWLESR